MNLYLLSLKCAGYIPSNKGCLSCIWHLLREEVSLLCHGAPEYEMIYFLVDLVRQMVNMGLTKTERWFGRQDVM